jgi:hypothetical protein
MSYENDRARMVSRANAREEAMEDHDRLRFLRQLDAAPVEITDWEANFLESTFQRISGAEGVAMVRFTLKERVVIDRMRRQYGRSLP